MGRKHRLHVLIFPYFAAILKRQVSPSAAFEVKGGKQTLPPGEITLIYPTSTMKKKYNQFFRFIATCKSVIRNICFTDTGTINHSFSSLIHV